MAMHHHAHRVPYEQQVDACLIHLHCIPMLLGPLTVVCPKDMLLLLWLGSVVARACQEALEQSMVTGMLVQAWN